MPPLYLTAFSKGTRGSHAFGLTRTLHYMYVHCTEEAYACATNASIRTYMKKKFGADVAFWQELVTWWFFFGLFKLVLRVGAQAILSFNRLLEKGKWVNCLGAFWG